MSHLFFILSSHCDGLFYGKFLLLALAVFEAVVIFKSLTAAMKVARGYLLSEELELNAEKFVLKNPVLCFTEL